MQIIWPGKNMAFLSNIPLFAIRAKEALQGHLLIYHKQQQEKSVEIMAGKGRKRKSS